MKRNPYSTDLAMLRDYLGAGFDPYDYSHLLEQFFDERGGKVPKWFDVNDPTSNLSRISPKDLTEFKEWALDQAQDAFTPSTAFFDFKRLVKRTTWLVHFSDNVSDIVRDGLASGHDDMRTLGLTTYFAKRRGTPGWNFAFRADGHDAAVAARKKKYGNDAVLFQSAGVEAHHYGDEEDQVIFWGPSVEWFVPLWREDREFQVKDVNTERVLVAGTFDKVVDWVKDNVRQYYRHIAYEKSGERHERR